MSPIARKIYSRLEDRTRPAQPGEARRAELDRDILSFVASRPRLVELAFVLAENGHTHVGQVAQLTGYTVRDLAGGDEDLTHHLRQLLIESGLDFGLEIADWQPPRTDAPDSEFE